MSAATLATIGTVLGGLILVALLPLILRIGRRVLAVACVLSAAAAGFVAGRVLVRIAGELAGDVASGAGPLWAGGLPLRWPDLAIFAVFLAGGVVVTLLLVREKA